MGDDGSLEAISLTPGETVRWRRREGGHWHDGVVIRREADGSVAVRDAQGAWRSIKVDRLEVRAEGRRGALHWEPVRRRAARPAQLRLWDGEATGDDEAAGGNRGRDRGRDRARNRARR